jgi:DNA-binding XRE family transcriptional regulator
MPAKIIAIQPYLKKLSDPLSTDPSPHDPQAAIVASRLKHMRWERSMGQAELAFHSDLQRQSIIRYERGTVVPNGRSLKALSQVLDVSTDYLLGLCNAPRPELARVENLNDIEYELIRCLRRAPTLEMQTRLINFLQALVADVPQVPS